MCRNRIPLACCFLLMAACTTVPTGPAVLALPGTDKSLEQFRADDVVCQQDALTGVGGRTAQEVADNSMARSAALGTVVGGAAGAALGGRGGAGFGAGAGLLMGGAAGTNAASMSAGERQRRYDVIYIQCMYGHGHRVPVVGAMPPP